MQFIAGEQITLNDHHYRVIDTLGGGALARVYLLEPVFLPGHQVVLKVPHREFDLENPADVRILDGLKREIEVLTTLNRAEDSGWDALPGSSERILRAQETRAQRRIVVMLDSGLIAPNQPFNIQEKAPKGFTRFPVSLYQDTEKYAFLLMRELLLAMKLVHEKGYALRDFDPETKIDRLRVDWLSKDKFELKIIDWNVTGNHEDQQRDLLFFGGHLLYALAGQSIVFEGPDHDRIPSYFDLDTFSQKLSSGARMILGHILHRDHQRRYHSPAEILTDVDWWISILKLCETQDYNDKLQAAVQVLYDGKKYERVLALGELALRQTIGLDNREIFTSLRQKAHQELSQQDQLPLLEAKEYMKDGYFSKAIALFSDLIKKGPAGSETVRLATLYTHLARDGEQIKPTLPDGQNSREHVLRSPAWGALQQARLFLEQKDPGSALEALGAGDYNGTGLKNWAQAYHSEEQAQELISREYRSVISYEDWLVLCHTWTQDLRQALDLYITAYNLIDEPRFGKEIERIKALLKTIDEAKEKFENLKTQVDNANKRVEHLKNRFPFADETHTTTDIEQLKEAAQQFAQEKPEVIRVLDECRNLSIAPTLGPLPFIDEWQTRLSHSSETLGKWHQSALARIEELNNQANQIEAARLLLEQEQYDQAWKILEPYAVASYDDKLRVLCLWAKTGRDTQNYATEVLTRAAEKLARIDTNIQTHLADSLLELISQLTDPNSGYDTESYADVFTAVVDQANYVLSFDQKPWDQLAKKNDPKLEIEAPKPFQLSTNLKQLGEYLKSRAEGLVNDWVAVKKSMAPLDYDSLVNALNVLITHLENDPQAAEVEMLAMPADVSKQLKNLSASTPKNILALVMREQNNLVEIDKLDELEELFLFAQDDDVKKSKTLLDQSAKRWWSLYKQKNSPTPENWASLNEQLKVIHHFADTPIGRQEVRPIQEFLETISSRLTLWDVHGDGADAAYQEFTDINRIKELWPELYYQFECRRVQAVESVCQKHDFEIAGACERFVAGNVPHKKARGQAGEQHAPDIEKTALEVLSRVKGLQAFLAGVELPVLEDCRLQIDWFKAYSPPDVPPGPRKMFSEYTREAGEYFHHPQSGSGKDTSTRLGLYLWIGALKSAAEARSRMRLAEKPLPGWIFLPWYWGGAQDTWKNLHNLAANSEKTSQFGGDLWQKLAQETQTKVEELQRARIPKGLSQLWTFLRSPQFLISICLLAVLACIFVCLNTFFFDAVMVGKVPSLSGLRADLHTAIPSPLGPVVYGLVGGTLGPTITATPTATRTMTPATPATIQPPLIPSTPTPSPTATSTPDCAQDSSGYSFTLVGEPPLQPSPGTDMNTMSVMTASVSWVLQNSGHCAWPVKSLTINQLAVIPVKPYKLDVREKADDSDDEIAVGEQAEITLTINRWEADKALGQWLLVLVQTNGRYLIISPADSTPSPWINYPGLNLQMDSCWVCTK